MPTRHDMNGAGGETILTLRKGGEPQSFRLAATQARVDRVAKAEAERDKAVELASNLALDLAEAQQQLRYRDEQRVKDLNEIANMSDRAIQAEWGIKALEASCKMLRGQVAHLTELLRRTAEYAPVHIGKQWSAAELQPLPQPGVVRIQHDFSDFDGSCVRCGATKQDVIRGAPVTCLKAV